MGKATNIWVPVTTVPCTSEGRGRRYWLSLEIRARKSGGEKKITLIIS
jgi:hypothetical protein